MEDTGFTINIELDKKIREKFPVPNWGDTLFKWLTPYLQKKYYTVVQNSYNKALLSFIRGVKYEYGIDFEQNLEKALKCYLDAANENDPSALYKLYSIHNSESSKFRIVRDKNSEMYYLLKAMAFLDCGILINFDTFYNIDVVYEIAMILDNDDVYLDKTNRLFMEMKGKVKDELELKFVEAMTLYKFNATDDDYLLGLGILTKMADNDNHLESVYKLAVTYASDVNDESAMKYFKILEEQNFYKCFNDYGNFLFKKKNYEKCREILKIGADQGNTKCFFLYYDLSLNDLDFEQNIRKLSDLLDLLVNDVITGNIYSLFEFFLTRKILAKHFNIKDYQGIEKHNQCALEFIDIMKSIYQDKSIINNVFVKGMVDTEFYLTYGFINYVGSEGFRDVNLAENLLKDSFKSSNYDSYKRFCYSLIFKIRMKRFKNNPDNLEMKNKLEKTKIKMFKIYMEAEKNNSEDFLSSSYYYYLAKLHENGWGTKSNDLFAYCYYYQASKSQVKNLGVGSIISYFRKYKAKKKLNNYKFLNIAEDLETYKKDQMSRKNEDSICCICFENEIDIIYYPCKHMTCHYCFEKLKSTNKCPQCRAKIILTK